MDLAVLGIRAEVQGVAQADAALEKLDKSAAKAEASTDKMAKAARGLAPAMNAATTGLGRNADAMIARANALRTGGMAENAFARQAQAAGMTVAGYEMQLARLAKEQRLAAEAAAVHTAAIGAEGQAAAKASTQLAVLDTATDRAARGSHALGTGLTVSTGKAARFGKEATDLALSLAMGLGPGAVAMQGVQMLGAYFSAATVEGAGLMRVLLPLLPIIIAIGLAVGTVAAIWSLATRSMANSMGDVTKGMGLTEKQLQHLKDKGVETGVTMTDVFKGFGTTVKETLQEAFGPELADAQRKWNHFLDQAGTYAMRALKGIGGGFVGTFMAIKAVWGELPAVFSDITVTAVNAMLRALQTGVNGAIAMINTEIIAANAISPNKLPLIPSVTAPSMNNPHAGAASRAARDASAAFNLGRSRFDAALPGNVMDSAQARVRGEAGPAVREAEAGAGRGRSGVAHETGQIVEHLDRITSMNLKPLDGQFVHMLEPLKIIADELAHINRLAQDSSRGMAEAFGESGKALGDLLTIATGYQSKLAEINLAEKEYRLTGAQADRERAGAQIQNYGDMASAAKGFFKEGSEGYRSMQAAEQAFRLVQFAMSVQATIMNQAESGSVLALAAVKAESFLAEKAHRIFQFAMSARAVVVGWAETAAHIAQSVARAAASALAGAARMFEALGPLGFPAVAAMLAVLAAVGLSGMGGHHSSAPAASAPTDHAAKAQAAQSQVAGQQAQARQAVAVNVKVETDDPMFRARVMSASEPVAAHYAGTAFNRARDVAPVDRARLDRMTMGRAR